MFEKGKIYRFDYPAHNYKGVRKRLERRRVRVERVRRLDEEPLEPGAVEADPLLNRGTTLVYGIDLDKAAERCFYLESMEDVLCVGESAELPAGFYRVALMEEGSSPEVVYIGQDAGQALVWAKEWLREPLGLTVGIMPPG